MGARRPSTKRLESSAFRQIRSWRSRAFSAASRACAITNDATDRPERTAARSIVRLPSGLSPVRQGVRLSGIWRLAGPRGCHLVTHFKKVSSASRAAEALSHRTQSRPGQLAGIELSIPRVEQSRKPLRPACVGGGDIFAGVCLDRRKPWNVRGDARRMD